MTDVVQDQPDGSEFDVSAEVPQQLDLLDVIGVSDIDPDLVSDTWQLTPDGELYVVRYDLLDLPRPLDPLEKLTGSVANLERSGESILVCYEATAATLNHCKELAGVSGGFELTDYAPDNDQRDASASVFFQTRGSGYWTLQAPAVGEVYSSPISKDRQIYVRHDRKLSAHLARAMAATDGQVEFIGQLKAMIKGMRGNYPDIGELWVLGAKLLDNVFDKDISEDKEMALKLDTDSREDVLIGALFSYLFRSNPVVPSNVTYDAAERKTQAFGSMVKGLAEQTGFDAEAEQAVALEREARLYEFFDRALYSDHL